MFWYCYETRNLINGKYYRGKSSAENPELDTTYLGSGPLLRKAIRKYGRENFSKTTLAVFNTEKEAYDYESKIITIKEIQDPNCYNIILGGQGGSKGDIYLYRGEEATRIHPNLLGKYLKEGWQKGFPEDVRKKHGNALRGKTHKGYSPTEEERRLRSLKMKGRPNLKNKGRKLSEDTRRKMSESHRGKIRGPRSEDVKQKIRDTLHNRSLVCPRVRITDGVREKLIDVIELDTFLKQGWQRGRTIKTKKI